jgi:hypothetical protein
VLIKNLVDSTSFEEIWGTLDPASQENVVIYNRFKRIWQTLVSLTPKKSKDELEISLFKGDLYLEAAGIGKDGEIYSLIATPWEECLGYPVDRKTLDSYTGAVILRELIWSISWLGETQEEIAAAIAELEEQGSSSLL